MKRYLGILLAVIMCFSILLPLQSYAEEIQVNTEAGEVPVEDITAETAEAPAEDAIAENTEAPAEDVTAETVAAPAEDAAAENTETQAQSQETAAETTGVSLDIGSPSALLMEASTGQVIFETGARDRRSPASVTKVMTLLLIFDALESGQIQLTDEVVTSAYAKSMGGSQVYLEEGEKQSVETMIKCIVIASGNDAAVAMAEFISGSEAEFVKAMNARAQGLNMADTNFEDCSGLTESTNHYTTAFDIALMSRELIVNYPQIEQYATIWMENITHVTDKGSSEFGLTNTNKLLRTFDGITGLKTGSTSIAKYCLSATAKRGEVELIGVIMAAPDPKTRFSDAATMLNYGFSKCNVFSDENTETLPVVEVKRGIETEVPVAYKEKFNYLDMSGVSLENVNKEIIMNENVEAPITEGSVAGRAVYTLDGKELGSVDILYTASVEKARFKDYFIKALRELWV